LCYRDSFRLTSFKISVGKHSRIQLRTLLNKNDSVIECIFNVGHLFIPHVNKENSTGMNSAEVKHVVGRHIQTQVNNNGCRCSMKFKHRQQRWQRAHKIHSFRYTIFPFIKLASADFLPRKAQPQNHRLHSPPLPQIWKGFYSSYLSLAQPPCRKIKKICRNLSRIVRLLGMYILRAFFRIIGNI
jgi:hypothetical protein